MVLPFIPLTVLFGSRGHGNPSAQGDAFLLVPHVGPELGTSGSGVIVRYFVVVVVACVSLRATATQSHTTQSHTTQNHSRTEHSAR